MYIVNKSIDLKTFQRFFNFHLIVLLSDRHFQYRTDLISSLTIKPQILYSRSVKALFPYYNKIRIVPLEKTRTTKLTEAHVSLKSKIKLHKYEIYMA